METNNSVDSTLSIARFIQGKYLKEIDGLFPADIFTMNDLPMEAFLEYCEASSISIKPFSPKGFSQSFEIKRIFLQFPFGEFLKINAFKSKSSLHESTDYVETHEGIYLGDLDGVPFAISNLFFFNTLNPGLLTQFLFLPKSNPEIKDKLLKGFSSYFTNKITANGPFQVDTVSVFNSKTVRWPDLYASEERVKEYQAFFESRLRPDQTLVSSYEDSLPSVTVLGPSGCGKSFLLNILMTEYPEYKFFMFRPSDDLNAFIALDFIERSKRFPKRVYIFEELDTLAESMNGLQIWRYLIEQGVEKGSGHTALVIATSSYPDILKTAVEFRPDLFGHVWRFDYPAESIRKNYLVDLLKEDGISETGWKQILEETEGYSFAWLKDSVREALFHRSIHKDISLEKALIHTAGNIKNRVGLVRDKSNTGGLGKKFGFAK